MTSPTYMIPVEVRGELGEHYPGNAVKMSPDGVFVTFQCHQGNLTDTTSDHEASKLHAPFSGQNVHKYSYENIRSVPLPSQASVSSPTTENPAPLADYRVGDQVEVWYTVNPFSHSLLPDGGTGQIESSLYSRPPPQPMAWWEARITKITKELLGMEILVPQPSKDGGSPATLRCSEIVDRNQVRRRNDQSHWTTQNCLSRTITLSPGCHLTINDPSVGDFLKRLGGNVLVESEDDGRQLTIFSPDRRVIHRVGLLEDSFIRLMQQKLSLMPHSSRRSEDREKGFSEVFSLDPDLIGMALGHHGRNIEEARSLPGIYNIYLDDDTKTFYVHGESQEAVNNAREMLEYMRDMIFVPQACVGRIIGQKGALLQEVIDKSQVIRVYVGGLNKEGTNVVFPNGLVAPVRDGFLPFQVVGRRSQLEDARLMIEFQIDLLLEIDRQTASMSDSRYSGTGLNGGPPRILSGGSGADTERNRETSLPPQRRGPRGPYHPQRGRGGRGGFQQRRDVDYDRTGSEDRQPTPVAPSGEAPTASGYHTDSALYDNANRGRGGRGRNRSRGGRRPPPTNGYTDWDQGAEGGAHVSSTQPRGDQRNGGQTSHVGDNNGHVRQERPESGGQQQKQQQQPPHANGTSAPSNNKEANRQTGGGGGGGRKGRENEMKKPAANGAPPATTAPNREKKNAV